METRLGAKMGFRYLFSSIAKVFLKMTYWQSFVNSIQSVASKRALIPLS